MLNKPGNLKVAFKHPSLATQGDDVFWGSTRTTRAGWGVYKLRAILLLATVLVGCQPADPVRTASPELQRQYNAAFHEMLNKPGDLEAALQYATVATKVGDLEGAISTYEGMLLIDSNLPRVRLELGVLYYRLKSYDAARTYLETALQSSTLPADVRKPAEQLLSKMPRQSRNRGA